MSQQAKANVSSETSSPPPPSYRVKVYCLDDTGKWEDKGTGYCVYLEGGGNDLDEIFVRSEADSTPLLSSIVQADRSYNKQQDTLIVWTELDKEDTALSFQDAESCEEIWLRIQQNNKRGGGHGNMQHNLDELIDEDNDDVDTASILQVSETLPQPKRNNLHKIASILTSTTVFHEKDELANFVLTDGYIDKLFPIFEYCEKAKKAKKLHHLYTIMKSIILLKDSSVIEYLMGDDIIINVAGMLEYDPDTPRMKATHRQVLEKQTNMELVVPLDDATTVSKMRQTFRLQYLRDVIMAKHLDETLTSMLQSLILFNHIDIISHIQYNSKFLTDLFDLLNPTSDATLTQKTKAVQFVLQLCSISKSSQSGARVLLFRTLARYGLFDAIEMALTWENDGIHTAGVSALSAIVDMDVSLLRTHILDQQTADDEDEDEEQEDSNDVAADDTEKKKKKKNKNDLLACIVHRFTLAKDSGLKFQYGDILKMLLETNTTPPPGALSTSKVLRKQMAGIDDILSVFYEKYAVLLLRPLQAIENKPMKLDGPIELLDCEEEQAEVYDHLLGFLCFAIQQHGFRSKYFMLSSDCFPKVAQLYRSRRTWIKLSALRFFRTCVGLLDDFFNRHLIKHNVFESTIRVLLDTDGKGNALNSACLELFEFIRSENPKLLVSHLIERFGSVLDTVDYIPTCSLLRQQYDENQQRSNTSTSLATSGHFEHESSHGNSDVQQSTSLDQYEEGYFNESDDDEDEKLDIFGSKIDEFISTTTGKSPRNQQQCKAKRNEHQRDVDELSDDDSDGDSGDDVDQTFKSQKDKHDNNHPSSARVITFISKHAPESEGELKNQDDIVVDNGTDDGLASTDIAKDDGSSNSNSNSDSESNGNLQDQQMNGQCGNDDKPAMTTTDTPSSPPPSTTTPSLPQPPPRRKRDDEEDDEDDVLAAKSSKLQRSSTATPASPTKVTVSKKSTPAERKKIVIKTQLKKPK